MEEDHTVKVTSDFSAVDPALTEGKTITMNGEQALEFIRTRKDVDDQTNLARMGRQRQFLTAFEEKLRGMNSEFAVTAYRCPVRIYHYGYCQRDCGKYCGPVKAV